MVSNDVVPGLLSVIIPTYNAEAHLTETLTSVLDQNCHSIEVVVVDDGSSDRSIAVAESFGGFVRVIAFPHRGLAATRNSGMTLARGEFLLHLDADDLLTQDSLSVRMKHFSCDTALEIVTGRLVCFLSPEMTAEERRRYRVPAEPQRGHLPGASIIRASAFGRFGLLDERYEVNADLDWSVRAQDGGARVRPIDDVVLRRRIHGRNLSLTRKSELDTSRLQILRASLGRRRDAGAGVPMETEN
jgi:glycosyltransferase involved in cell wall biosynthesis